MANETTRASQLLRRRADVVRRKIRAIAPKLEALKRERAQLAGELDRLVAARKLLDDGGEQLVAGDGDPAAQLKEQEENELSLNEQAAELVAEPGTPRGVCDHRSGCARQAEVEYLCKRPECSHEVRRCGGHNYNNVARRVAIQHAKAHLEGRV